MLAFIGTSVQYITQLHKQTRKLLAILEIWRIFLFQPDGLTDVYHTNSRRYIFEYFPNTTNKPERQTDRQTEYSEFE